MSLYASNASNASPPMILFWQDDTDTLHDDPIVARFITMRKSRTARGSAGMKHGSLKSKQAHFDNDADDEDDATLSAEITGPAAADATDSAAAAVTAADMTMIRMSKTLDEAIGNLLVFVAVAMF